MIEFAEWKPDIAALESDGATVATNVVPGVRHYLPLQSAQVVSTNAMDGDCLGATGIRDPSTVGDTYNFFGTADKLYKLTNGEFADVSIAGGYSGSGTDDRWEFAQVGSELIATNFANVMQTYTLGSSSLFANLGGTPPQARHIAKIGEFLIAGNTYDAVDGYKPQRVRWAGIGTTTSWTVSATTQADYQDLDNDGGWIQRVIGGDAGGIIFQEYKIIRMTYVGSPLVFQFDEVKGARGTVSPGSVINTGDFIAYCGQDGFYMFDGQTSVPIGAGKVDQTFFNDVDIGYINQMSSALFPYQQIVVWSYRSVNAANDVNDTLLFFNYSPNAKKRWSKASVDHSIIYDYLSEGYTLEQLDDFGAGNQTLETLPYSLDSRAYVGNQKFLGSVATDFYLNTFTGTAMNATIETAEVQLSPGKRTLVTLVRPYVDGTSNTLTMQVGKRESLASSLSYGSAVSLNSAGFAPVRSSSRYHRLRTSITGNFTAAQGVDVIGATELGRR